MIKTILSCSLVTLPGILNCNPSHCQHKNKSNHPNIIIFLSDDQGYGDFSSTGNLNINTRNIDAIASEGTMFNHFYVSPVCSPTRAEFLTGRYHLRSGVYGTSQGAEHFNLNETTIAEVFKNAGYVTAAFGKWHNGMQYPYHPNGRGFDVFYGFCSGHWGDYFSPMLEYNGRLVQGDGYLPDDLTNKAIDFIEENKNNPFFLFIPYNTPHSPMQVPDLWWDKIKDKELVLYGNQPGREDVKNTKAALAMCENIDWNVGRVISTLKKLDLEQNTIIIYFSDNGPNSYRWNAGLKGIKSSVDEGGVRSPLFIKWQGIIPSGKLISSISSVIDLLPTLADFAGIELNTRFPVDGVSLKPLILYGENNYPDRVIFSNWNGHTSLRNQQYRYNDYGELYDMVIDPRQTKDISNENPELSEYFNKMIYDWKLEVARNKIQLSNFFPVGHPEFKYTQLPAQDGIHEGGVERSAKAPNCSFFKNWNSLSGKISWPIDVLTDGNFEVEFYYTCPKGDEGSELLLTYKQSKMLVKITEPFDPPLKGMENDRVERKESYIKNFKLLNAGEIYLDKGKGMLTLEAINIPNSYVMDLFMIRLISRN